MTGVNVERLPGETFAKYMLLEARSLALSHLKDSLLSHDNMTLGSDGTTKFGHHFGSCEVNKPYISFPQFNF